MELEVIYRQELCTCPLNPPILGDFEFRFPPKLATVYTQVYSSGFEAFLPPKSTPGDGSRSTWGNPKTALPPLLGETPRPHWLPNSGGL
jgi:hypothetical protein